MSNPSKSPTVTKYIQDFTGSPCLITVRELIDVASQHGIHLTHAHVRHALHTAALRAVTTDPVQIHPDEANRYLTWLWRAEARQ